MKTITKITSAALLAAIVSTTAAFADNQRLENRLIRQRTELAKKNKETSVAVDPKGQGIGSGTEAAQPQFRFGLRYNAHGQSTGSYTPAE
jgi:hypothetical protein